MSDGPYLHRILIIALVLLTLAFQPLVSADEPSKSSVYTIKSTYEVKNEGPFTTARDVFICFHPFRGWSNWASQEVRSTDISPTAKSVTENEEVSTATVYFDKISAGGEKTIVITQRIKVNAVDLQIDPETVGTTVSPALSEYTQPVEDLWESGDERIRQEAQRLIENQPNFYYKAKRILDFVIGYLEYEEQTVEHGALWAYEHRKGDCTEFTNLFIALCRAAGIPTKSVVSYVYIPPGARNTEDMGHAFALVYLPNVGWTPVNLTMPLGTGSFGELGYDHIIFSNSGKGDPPGIRAVWIDSYTYIPPKPKWDYKLVSSKVIPEVVLDLSFDIGRTGNILEVLVTITNVGKQDVKITNTKLRILENNSEVFTISKDMDKVLSQASEENVSFEVRIKEPIHHPKIVAVISYSSGGELFLAEGWRATTSLNPMLMGELTDIILLGLGVALVALIAILAWTLVRRSSTRVVEPNLFF